MHGGVKCWRWLACVFRSLYRLLLLNSTLDIFTLAGFGFTSLTDHEVLELDISILYVRSLKEPREYVKYFSPTIACWTSCSATMFENYINFFSLLSRKLFDLRISFSDRQTGIFLLNFAQWSHICLLTWISVYNSYTSQTLPRVDTCSVSRVFFLAKVFNRQRQPWVCW